MICSVYPKASGVTVSVVLYPSAESRFVSGMWMSPCKLHFLREDLLKVRLLVPVLFPTVNESAIISCEFLRYYYLQ